MISKPPFDHCDGCTRPAAGSAGTVPTTWARFTDEDGTVTLDDGRQVARRGACWVCRHCGHTTPRGREHANRSLVLAALAVAGAPPAGPDVVESPVAEPQESGEST